MKVFRKSMFIFLIAIIAITVIHGTENKIQIPLEQKLLNKENILDYYVDSDITQDYIHIPVLRRGMVLEVTEFFQSRNQEINLTEGMRIKIGGTFNDKGITLRFAETKIENEVKTFLVYENDLKEKTKDDMSCISEQEDKEKHNEKQKKWIDIQNKLIEEICTASFSIQESEHFENFKNYFPRPLCNDPETLIQKSQTVNYELNQKLKKLIKNMQLGGKWWNIYADDEERKFWVNNSPILQDTTTNSETEIQNRIKNSIEQIFDPKFKQIFDPNLEFFQDYSLHYISRTKFIENLHKCHKIALKLAKSAEIFYWVRSTDEYEKSFNWVFAQALKMQDTLTKNQFLTLDPTHPSLYFKEGTIICFDDGSYSGSQLEADLGVCSVSKFKTIAVVPFFHENAFKFFQNKTEIFNIDAQLINISEDNFDLHKYLNSDKKLFIVYSQLMKNRFYFDHKIADSVSLGRYVATMAELLNVVPPYKDTKMFNLMQKMCI